MVCLLCDYGCTIDTIFPVLEMILCDCSLQYIFARAVRVTLISTFCCLESPRETSLAAVVDMKNNCNCLQGPTEGMSDHGVVIHCHERLKHGLVKKGRVHFLCLVK